MRTNSGGSQYAGYGYMPGTNSRVLYGSVIAGIMYPSLDFYGPDGKLLANYRFSQGSTPTETARYLYLEGKPLNWPEERIGSGGNYMPYGDYTSTSQNPNLYATYFGDAGTGSGGYFAKQRYYNSNWGRFLTVDPLGSSAKLASPQSWNRYGYVLGDPVNSNDPTGLDYYPCPEGSNCVEVVAQADPVPYDFGYSSNYYFSWCASAQTPFAYWNEVNSGGSGADPSSAAPSNNHDTPDQWPFNGKLIPGTHPQDGVCTTGPFSNAMNSDPLVLACCQAHDKCYAQHQCNATSWVPILTASCTLCNIKAVACITQAVLPVGPLFP